MSFFKTTLATLLGSLLAAMLLVTLFFMLLISSSSQPEPYIEESSVLKINLTGMIPYRVPHNPFQELVQTGPTLSVQSVQETLEKATHDDRIDALWLQVNRVSGSWASLSELRESITTFRETSGKPIYALTDDIGMNMGGYFLASAADTLLAPDQTYLELNGFSIQLSFFPELFEKIGIEPEITRVGEYKSAVEPFLRQDASPQQREQIGAILDQVHTLFLSEVSESRNLSTDELDRWLGTLPSDPVSSALDAGLIDRIGYPEDLETTLRRQLEIEEEDDLPVVSMQRYRRVSAESAGEPTVDPEGTVAIIYASGMIIPQTVETPFDSQPVITAGSIASSLETALEDDDVKSIVLAINSGGGAVSTSELLYESIRRAAEKKPVIAWFGDVAASGGYYMAMGADEVMATSSTITGSIGIYSMMFNSEELYNDHLGIRFETLKTHEHADWMSMTRRMSDVEQSAMQSYMQNGYDTFLDRVATNRGQSTAEIEEVAQGCVWTGKDALEQGLVDRLGSLDDAIARAAERGGLEAWDTLELPRPKPLFEALFASADASARSWIRDAIPFSRTLEENAEPLSILEQPRQIWAILPVDVRIQ
ncbi:MAG: signal peptide peptidase SppA [Bacteroidota bacterium]